jgi:DNA-binding HxlR family transcriptional regulator
MTANAAATSAMSSPGQEERAEDRDRGSHREQEPRAGGGGAAGQDQRCEAPPQREREEGQSRPQRVETPLVLEVQGRDELHAVGAAPPDTGASVTRPVIMTRSLSVFRCRQIRRAQVRWTNRQEGNRFVQRIGCYAVLMPLGSDYARQDCLLARALELVGERWTLLIVRDAFYGVRRYNDFLAHLDIPRAVLAARLLALVGAGILERRPYREAAARVEYVLTARGRALWPAIYALAQWGEEHLAVDGPGRIFVHVGCDARIDAAGVCPSCARRVPPEELEVHSASATPRTDPVARALERPHRLLQPLFDARPAAAGR